MVYAPRSPRSSRRSADSVQVDNQHWATCAGCSNDRRVTDRGVMENHRRYAGSRDGMVRCPGAGRPPAPPIVRDLQQRAAAEAAQIRGTR